MNKREVLKLKQTIKKQQKEERETIINSYISQIKDVIDEGYIEMMSHIDEFNQELISYTIEYANLEKDITKLLKEELNIDLVEDINKRMSIMESNNDEVYSIVTNKNIKDNKLLRHLPIIAKSVSGIITKANDDLKDNRNRYYLISSITNRSFDVFKKYNSVIMDVSIESNEYIDVYAGARESFVNLIQECKSTLDDNFKEDIEQLEKVVKYKQRLRVTYNELEKFLKYRGFKCNRQGNTTHAVWKHSNTGKSIPIPNKSGTVCQGTTSKVLKQIGSNRQELADFLYT